MRPNSYMRNTGGKILMKVVQSDRFLITYVENCELNVVYTSTSKVGTSNIFTA